MTWKVKGGPGKVREDFHIVGNPMMPVYLLNDDNPVLFDAGMPFMAPVYSSQLNHLGKGGIQPHYLFITHVHYDHIGGAYYLKEKYPVMKTGASEYASQLLKKEKVIKHINELSKSVARGMKKIGLEVDDSIPFKKIQLDFIFGDAESVKTGKYTISTYTVPGHTRCSMAYFIEELGALIAGEAPGVPFLTGEIQPEFLSDYESYYRSLIKMRDLEPEIICLAHGGVLDDGQAKRFLDMSISATEAFREKVEKLLKKHMNIEKVVNIIASEEYRPEKTTQPKPAYMLNLQAKVRCISRIAGIP